MKHKLIKSLSLAAIAATLPFTIQAQLLITEVNPTGSGASYAADWFELKNTGASALNITGWKIDDNSNAFGSAVALRGITSIAPGQVVLFLESNGAGGDAVTNANFTAAWFGGSIPAGLTLGNYGGPGSGVGLSSSGDAVNIFDGSGTLQAKVTFGSATAGFTFDNTAGLNNTAISQLSVAGVNGAFLSFAGVETGSPGFGSSVVPEPSTLALGSLAIVGTFLRRRK